MSVAQAEPGVVAGRYRLGHHIGQGGSGVVWQAEDLLLKRRVAMKELVPPLSIEPHERRRLQESVLREARAAARLHHPGAVSVYDVAEEGDRQFIVMELVDAPNLAEVVQSRGPMAPERVAAIGLELIEVLHAAHQAGLVHRDVKPANVLVPPGGRTRLSDFGIASIIDDPSVTATGILKGTPSFMAPEQAMGAGTGPATDFWSLGATLYFAVEGRSPFEKGHALATLAAIAMEDPRPTERAGSLAAVLDRLLAKDPAARPDYPQLRSWLQEVAAPPVAAVEPPTLPQAAAGVPWPAERVPGPMDAAPTPPVVVPTPPPVVALTPPVVASIPPPPSAPAAAPAPPHADGPTPVPAPAPWPAARARGRSGADTHPLPFHRPARAGRGAKVGALAGFAVVAAVAAFLALGPLARTPHGASNPPASGLPQAQAPVTAVPAGWTSYTDGAVGFKLAYPAGWTVSRHETLTDFRDPNSGTYLRIDHQSPPAPTPDGPWYAMEKSFASSNPGYQRIGITPTVFHGDAAAIWEYTYGSTGNRQHAIDLGMIAGPNGLAFNFQTADAQWAQQQALLRDLENAFQP